MNNNGQIPPKFNDLYVILAILQCVLSCFNEVSLRSTFYSLIFSRKFSIIVSKCGLLTRFDKTHYFMNFFSLN